MACQGLSERLLWTSPGQQLKEKRGPQRPLTVWSCDPLGLVTRTSCSSWSDGSIGEVTVSYLGQEKSYFKSWSNHSLSLCSLFRNCLDNGERPNLREGNYKLMLPQPMKTTREGGEGQETGMALLCCDTLLHSCETTTGGDPYTWPPSQDAEASLHFQVDKEEWERPYLHSILVVQKHSAGLPWWSSGIESVCQCRGHGFDPWSGEMSHATGQLSPSITTTEATL